MKIILVLLAVLVAGLWATGIIGPREPSLQSQPMPTKAVPFSPATSTWIETPASTPASASGRDVVPTETRAILRSDGTSRTLPPPPVSPVEIATPNGERVEKFSLPSAVAPDSASQPTQ